MADGFTVYKGVTIARKDLLGYKECEYRAEMTTRHDSERHILIFPTMKAMENAIDRLLYDELLGFRRAQRNRDLQ